MISLTRGLSNPSSFIHLGKEFHKDLDMCAHFLASWNGFNLFLPPFSPCYDFVSLVTDASGSIGYGAFFHLHWFNGKWLPHQQLGSSPDISIARQELFPTYLLVLFGAPSGVIGMYVSLATTKHWCPLSIQKAQKFPASWISLGPLPFSPSSTILP